MHRAVIFILLLFVYQGLTAQLNQTNKEKAALTDRVLVGGGLGLQFGTITFVEVSPKVGYRITEHFAAGIGGTYKYFRDQRYDRDYSTSMLGGRLFLQHDIYDSFYGYGELEYLSYEGYDMSRNISHITSENILFGAGYKQWFSRKAYAYLMLLYNINETIETPYSNPVFRTGFMIRL
ncbi:MAG: hypothetical protein K9H84_02815 [Bacteroidales bacterium]|nr:hypothetical protein [Bacteroidales bacterium]